ncbi:MAG: ABC-type lipoprotein release transport system permease subunit [Cognaticolwellia sp.]
MRLATITQGDYIRDISVLGRVVISFELVDFGVVALFIVGQLAVLYPARKASMIAPAIAIRRLCCSSVWVIL